MAISYSNEATECTEAEIKNKPKDEQKILNDDDATQAAEKKQENANPDKNEKPDPSGSVSESVKDDKTGEIRSVAESDECSTGQDEVNEDALPEEKLAIAKTLVEEVQIENEIMALVNEAAEELCLDEEYVKNEVRKDAIIKGKLMKEAKAHAKAAKTAIKKMDTETAISEQEQYVDALKKLYEECSNIKDDSKMIIVSSAVIRGLLASTGALLVGAELTVVHGMTKHGGMKTDGAILDVKSEKDQELAYNALSRHFGSKTGKIEIAATAVVSIVSGIIAGVLKYKKGMLKYGVKNEKTHKLEVAKSRIEAQQRLRRMVRLAEQILNEYKSIQKIESGK